MRYLIVEVVLASLLFFGGAAAFGAEVSEYEKACLDLGFKKRTPAYGECVLELDKRTTEQQKQAERVRVEQQERQDALQRQYEAQQKAAKGDGSPDHKKCFAYGFMPGTVPYSDCRLRVELTNKQMEQAESLNRRSLEEQEKNAREFAAQAEASRQLQIKLSNLAAWHACVRADPYPHMLNCDRWKFCGFGGENCPARW